MLVVPTYFYRLIFQAAASGEKKVFALIIVDVQNDFITGSLAVSEGKISVKLTLSFLQSCAVH